MKASERRTNERGMNPRIGAPRLLLAERNGNFESQTGVENLLVAAVLQEQTQTGSRAESITRHYGGFLMKLLNMTVRRTFPVGTLGVIPQEPKEITHSTLIDQDKDIFALAKKGVDPIGDPILAMEIECADGQTRTYSPEALAELAPAGE